MSNNALIPTGSHIPQSKPFRQSTRVLFVRNNMPFEGAYGGDEVVLDIVAFLHNAGCTVEFVSLTHQPSGAASLNLAPILKKIYGAKAPSSIRFRGILIRTSPLAWAVRFEKLLGNSMPKYVSRFIKKLRPAVRLGSLLGEFRNKVFFDEPDNSDVRFVGKAIRGFKPDVMRLQTYLV